MSNEQEAFEAWWAGVSGKAARTMKDALLILAISAALGVGIVAGRLAALWLGVLA